MITENPLPKLLPPGDWYRRMTGPFYGVVQDSDTFHRTWTPPEDSLETMIRWFFDGYPYDAMRVAVLDESGWIVLGTSAFNSNQVFWGSEIGFAVADLLRLADPVTLAMWESVARDASDSPAWWGDDGGG